jgi:hypothetical protein
VTKEILTISLGAAWKSYRAALAPGESITAAVGTAKQLVTIPEDAEPGLRAKAEALAGVWMETGMNLVGECKTAGQRFTEDK